MESSRRYDNLPPEALIALLERRDARRSYGLVWEREGITPDTAVNDDFVVLDLDEPLSTTRTDDTGWRNLVIEGDNWDALRALRLTYAGRVKTILIDPPYNTGNRDFVYNDRFVGPQDRYRQSVWLEFLYKRLVIARDLLADDGVILVCINDENRARLDLLMEQVFPGMRLGSFVWRTKDTNNSDKRRNWSGVHEHVVDLRELRIRLHRAGCGTGQVQASARVRRGSCQARPYYEQQDFSGTREHLLPCPGSSDRSLVSRCPQPSMAFLERDRDRATEARSRSRKAERRQRTSA